MDRLFQRLRMPLVIVVLFATVVLPMAALAGASTFQSDAFNSKNLMRPRWTFTDPNGDATLKMAGYNTDSAQVQITVPAGSEHDLWSLGYGVPRITQACANEDFTVDVKLLSSMHGISYQTYFAEGIVVEQDSANLLRFDFTTGHEIDSVKAFSAAFVNGFSSPTPKINNKFFAGYDVGPLWLRVSRTGNTWKMYYSLNGTVFTLADSFVHAMTVTKIGLFAGNAGPNPSAFTMKADYFFNSDSPVVPEEGTPVTDNLSPLVYNVRLVTQPNCAIVYWKTDEPADGQIDWGTTTAYSQAPITHSGYFNTHRLIITPLDANTDYHFRIRGMDEGLNTTVGSDIGFTSGAYIDDKGLISDDFHAASIDGSIWSQFNPTGDANFGVSGKQLSIAVPAGEHDLWTSGYRVPTLMQDIDNDANVYDWVVKFNGPFTGTATSNQLRGIVVQQDTNNLVRFQISHDGTSYRLYAGGFYDGLINPETFVNDVIPVTAPVWLRVAQSGGQFRVYYSTNGTSWTIGSVSTRPFYAKKIGVYAGNVGSNPQAFTMLAEYVATTIPAKPNLATPLNNALDVLAPPTAVWDTTASATSYRLQVATDAGFASPAFNDSTITLTRKQVAGLLYSQKYYWRVRGKNANGVGAYSDVYNFTTAVAPPSAPSLSAPADNAVDVEVTPTLRWSKPAGTLSFRLQVSTDTSFAAGLVYNDSTLTDSTKALPALANLTKFYWRVNAKNGGGTSSYSAVRAFTTISAIPLAPAQITPPNNAVNQQVNVVLRWNRSNAATSYRLQVGTDETFATGVVVNDSTLTDTSKAMSGLANSTKYYWRVNAKNTAGTGVYSATWAFTTIVANPSIPALVGPADGATNQDLTVKYLWGRIAGATSYRLQVATDSTFATGLVVNDSTVTDSTKTVGGLVFGSKYFWRVNSKNIGGTSPYSSIWSFRTYDSDPAIPKQLAPANRATGVFAPLTITWTRPVGATSFHLQVATDSTFAGGLLVNDATLADTFKTLASVAYVTTYYWRVNADAVSGTSPYSPVRRFTTGIPTASTPALVFPVDGYRQSTDSLRLVWRASTPAIDRYWVDLSVDSTFTNFVVPDSMVTDTTKMVRSLLPNIAYFWRVRAHNGGGWGAYSVGRKFTRDVTGVAERPEVPTVVSLSQNYPNPFNPATRIEFALPKESKVMIEVFNLLGARVATLVDETRSAGYHVVAFDASSMPSGLYIYRLAADQMTLTRKMMLVK